MGKTRGNSGKPDEHERQVEDADEDGQQDQLTQKGATCCRRFVGKNLGARPVDKTIVAQVKVEEGGVEGARCLLQEEKNGKSWNQPAVSKDASKPAQSGDQVQLPSVFPLGQNILQPEGSVDSGEQEGCGGEEENSGAAKVGGDQAGQVVTCHRAQAQARLGCSEPLQPGGWFPGSEVAQVGEGEDEDGEGTAAQPVQEAGQVVAEEWQARII